MAFKIQSQLSENQIESDVSSYLGFVTPIWSKRFRLISVNEQLTGADKLFDRFFPIYLQFKVSHGLSSGSTLLEKYREKPLAKIIEFRTENNLAGNPILYFPLRRQAKTASSLQHNILFRLNDPPNQYALYVAPLTLELSDYENQLNGDWFLKFYPFDLFMRRELEIHDVATQRRLALGLNPFLRHHISIPPHTSVFTHEHHYSFSKSGGEVAWHGGEILYDDFRLSNQLQRIINNSYKNVDLGMTINRFLDFIDDFNNEYSILDYRVFDRNNIGANQIINFGLALRREFQINVMLLSVSQE